MKNNKNNYKLKEVIWMGDSRKCISRFPVEVKRTVGHALYFAQVGELPQYKNDEGFG
jgi:phage-related protein